jgi:betaine-aldehyde dehydrogenase
MSEKRIESRVGEGTLPFLIDGRWTSGKGTTFESINPANGEVAAIVAQADAEDVDTAVRAANAALGKSDWRDLKAHQRARLLYRLAELVDRDAERLAQIQTLDNGKTIAESRHQAKATADIFRYYAALCETLESSVVPERGNYLSFTLREPVGVVAAITPWNSPLTLEAQKLAPALAAGNAVVMKSSEYTPLIGLEFARLALEAGFPAGVLNVVTGFGKTVGEPLILHPMVDMVTFTGGTATGRAIAKTCGERLIPSLVELGGKSPNIIFEDADMEQAVVGAMYAIFTNSGQSCIAGSRIFVQASIYDQFVARLAEATAQLRVGDPHDPLTAVAPFASFQHRDRVESHIELGVKEGGRVLVGGQRPSDPALSTGAYFQPTLIEVDNNSLRVAQEEIFGTVAVLLRFENEEDLIKQANDSMFGLACGIWTEDYRRAMRTAKAVRAGTIWVNTYKQTAIGMPFGGFRDSGLWRECGIEGLKYYQENKSVYLDLSGAPLPWPPRH